MAKLATPVREQIEGHRSLPTFRFVVGLFLVLSVAFVVGQAATFYKIGNERQKQLNELCSQVEGLRMNIRDFLDERSSTSDKLIREYFDRVDCQKVTDAG